VTCQAVGGVRLYSFNLKEKWETSGRGMLIGWANKRNNGKEYQRKEGVHRERQ
jgi:hypothetical protein